MSGKQLECLSAVTAVLDLANGLDSDKSVLTGLFALELAQEAGLGDDDLRDAFFVGLLRHLGCTAFAAVEAQVADDDLAWRGALARRLDPNVRGVAAALFRSAPSVLSAAKSAGRLALNTGRLKAEWAQELCGAARVLSQQLHFGPRVVEALEQAFERWDGEGAPRGLKGDALSLLGRVAQAANVAVVFYLEGGAPLARELLISRSGTVLDPKLAKAANGVAARFEQVAQSPERFTRVEALVATAPLEASLHDIAVTFGDIADLQSPFTRGHSRRVAALTDKAAGVLGLSADERSQLALAAQLHDIGQVALPATLWLRPRWSDADRKKGTGHTHFTEQVLSASAWGEVGRIAAAHHERLDGLGTHKRLSAAGIPRAARLLAAADMACALLEDRPHRKAHAPSKAQALLAEAAKAGQLDGDCVAVVLEGLGAKRPAVTSAVASLTEREVDVLRELAHGKTNKEIAAVLGISSRTVQHHTINLYAKLDVTTRAAAALVAARAGLV
ncbi:MAG: HD domain-containing protein [Myxococcaceae bacterium]|nr:HD domain-containing protein [Myxococcaceae bacterium]